MVRPAWMAFMAGQMIWLRSERITREIKKGKNEFGMTEGYLAFAKIICVDAKSDEINGLCYIACLPAYQQICNPVAAQD